jgi:hypothetical protein
MMTAGVRPPDAPNRPFAERDELLAAFGGTYFALHAAAPGGISPPTAPVSEAMMPRFRQFGSVLAAALLAAVTAPHAAAQFTYANFPNATGLTLVGNASISTSNSRLRVTPNAGGQVGAAWFTTKQTVAPGFTTTFTFSMSPNGGADGIAFVIQNSAVNAIGLSAGGCQIGYDGLANSVAIEFDTYQSGACDAGEVFDPNNNHVSIHTRGPLENSARESASIGLNSTIPDLNNGSAHTCQVVYVPGRLQVFIDDLVNPAIDTPLDLDNMLTLDAGRAWVGFTAATGGASETHDVRSWSFTPTSNPQPGDAQRPATPRIEEPGTPGQILNGADVHMVTGQMSSPVGAQHRCSDWEIWKVNPGPLEKVWSSYCATGALAVHIHLADGIFSGSFVGRTTLEQGPDFVLRVRHRDNSNSPSSEYSRWALRSFRTAPADQLQPLTADDFVDHPTPAWDIDGVGPLTLPSGALMELGSAQGELLLRLDGTAAGNTITNPPVIATHVPVRVRVAAPPTQAMNLGLSTITVVDHECIEHEIYLPAISLAPAGQALFWVDTSGATYQAQPTDTVPTFGHPARATELPWTLLQTGYVIERFATNFRLPVNIAFLPSPGPGLNDPYFYVTELYGQIMMVTRSGQSSVYAGTLLNYNPTGLFPGSGESGLAGICIEPTTGDLFATLLNAIGGDPNQLRPRIVRFHSTDGGRTAASQTLIRDFPTEPQGQSHQISNITIGPDGKLYIHMGDGFDATRGQNLDSARGKILRLNLDGSVPTDNPFYSTADGITARDMVWVYGIRNPFGGAWRLSDAKHFTVENGPSVDRIFMAVAGRNYLYDGSDTSMTNFAAYNWSIAHGPVNIAFQQTGVGYFDGGYPAATANFAFVSESGPTYASGPQSLGKRIVSFNFAADGTLLAGPSTLAEYHGDGYATAVALAFGPDGLYFSELYKDTNTTSPIDRGADILRIRYIGGGGACAPHCPADFNENGTATVQDIFDFLAAYFAGTPGADFNGTGGITVQDIFDFLAAYFTGCP